MRDESYFIKPGYRTNKVLTADGAADSNYWNRRRITSSRYYQFPVYRFARTLVKKLNIRSCTDVGCGIGTKLAWLHSKESDLRYCGIDQASAIDYCRRTHPFGSWLVEDLDCPKRTDVAEPAELVICADVIEHLDDPNQLLDYLRTVTTKRGYILLSTPERDLYRGRDSLTPPNKFHVREWNAEEFKEYLRSRGFEILDHLLQYPVRFGPSLIVYREVVSRALRGQPLRYNQVWLLRAP